MGIQVFLMWPETRQMSLEEIDVLFDGKIPAWKSASLKSRFDEEVEALRRQRTEKPQDDLTQHEGSTLQREDSLVQDDKRVSKEIV